MISRTAAFDYAITNGGQVVTKAEITRGGAVQATIDLLPGATIALDDTVASRRTFTGQTANTGLAPHRPGDTLAPFGIEMVVYSGLVTPAAPAGELLQVGVFRVNVVQDDTTGLINISGPDRSAVVAAALNESPYTIPAGTPLDVAIGEYAAAKYPSLPFLPDDAAHGQLLASAAVYQAGTSSGDPFSNMMALATEFGRELFLDPQGNLILRPVPDPTTWPVSWRYAPGTANLAISGTHTIDTSTGIANVAIVSSGGTGVTVPVSASEEITDPTSPIYPNPNGFGRRPAFLASSQLVTNEQCDATALAILNKQPGLYDQYQFTAIPHPAHEPSDVVVYESELLGVQVPIVLSAWKLQIDLQAPVDYTTRTAGAVQEQVIEDLINATLTGT